jgi:hypothetical protein
MNEHLAVSDALSAFKLIAVLLSLGLSWDDAMRRQSPAVPPAAPPPEVIRSQPIGKISTPPPASIPPASPGQPPTPVVVSVTGAEALDSTASDRPPSASKAAKPTVWQLADASGQVWTHTDRAWLKQWVSLRNQALASVVATPRRSPPQQPSYQFSPSYQLSPSYQFSPAGNCAGGACGVR